MKQVYKNLWVGDDEDYEQVKSSPDWRIVRSAKDGLGGHRDTLGYTSQGAPRNEHYLFTERGNRLVLNMIDVDNPDFIPEELVNKAVSYIKEQIEDHKVLVCCNKGISRAPSIALLYLYTEGKLPRPYPQAVRMFRKLYPKYDPSAGIHIFTRRKISELRAKNG